MNNPNYSSDNQNIARNADSNLNSNVPPSASNDETQTLRWDSAWQPDLDEDYGTPVQQYSGPGAFPPLPPQPPSPPVQHPYAQAAQSVPVQSYPTPTYANPPLQGYSTPTAGGYNTPPAPYAPVQVYVGDQPAPPTYQPGQLQDNQAYKGYMPPAQGYNGQPLPPQSPATRQVQGWVFALVIFIALMVILGSGGWVGFWPFWLFIFWPLMAFGGRGRYGRGYGRRWRNRNRW